jgi:hypothetical protein
VRTLVFGCGPAGLIAAQAALESGSDVAILSKNRKSFMKGAQYLHRPISGIDCGQPFEIEYLLVGSAMQYRRKVYGPTWDGTTSPEDMTASHSAWDIRVAYDALWEKFHTYIVDWEATYGGAVQAIESSGADLVVSTIPAPLLCNKGHTFRSARIFSSDVDMGIEDNTVVCNGEEAPRWYRAAKIRGWTTVEWPDGASPPVTPMWEVLKPLDNNCDCFPEIVHGGRYGAWKKGVLSHEVFDIVSNEVHNRLREQREVSQMHEGGWRA